MKTKPKVGVALSSGGARGGVHIGVLRVLEKENIPIDCLSGSSAGAIVAGCYACGTLDKLETFLAKITRREMIKIFDPHFSSESLIKGKRTINLLRELTDDKSFPDIKMPIYIMASDIKSGEEVVLNKGKIAEALFASMCVPPLYKPVVYQNRLLVDGGLMHLLPVEILRRNNCDIVIASTLKMKKTISFEKNSLPIKTYKTISSQIIKAKKEIFQYKVLQNINLIGKMFDGVNNYLSNKDRYTTVRAIMDCLDIGIESPEVEEKLADLVIRTDVNGIRTIDLHRSTECIKRGTDEAEKNISLIRDLFN